MTFAGSRFLQFLGAFMVGLAVTGFVFGVGYNFLPPHHTKLWELIMILLVGIIIGVLFAKLAWNFIKSWVVSIMAAAAVVVLVLMLLGVADVTIMWVKIAAIFVGIFVGGYVGRKLNKPIKTFGTAFVGSFMVVRGSSFYIGGWPGEEMPSLHHHKYDAFIFAYLAAFLILWFAGSLIQLRMIRDEDVDEDEDDAFKGEDEGRTCGCF